MYLQSMWSNQLQPFIIYILHKLSSKICRSCLAALETRQIIYKGDVSMSEENNNQTNYTFWAEQVNPSPHQECNQCTHQEYNQCTTDSNQTIHSQYSSQQQPPKKSKKVKKVFSYLGKAAVFGIIAGLAFYASNRVADQLTDKDKDQFPSSITVSSNANGDLNLDKPSTGTTIPSTIVSTNVNIQSTDVSQVVTDTMPAIVAITSSFDTSYNLWGYEYGGEQSGGGSGIIIGQKDNTLYIATNNHVVDAATKIVVTFTDETQAEAQIRGRNSSADLAVITVDTSTLSKETLDAIKVAKLGNSDDVKVGQMAIAIGNALGYGQSVTVGYISAKEREITVDKGVTLTVLQTDAAINPGNSGGALINMNGEVIGINSAKFSQTSVEGIGYSIPITIAYPIVDELMNREILTDAEKGYLGLYPQDVDESVAQMYDWPIGVYVYSLVEGGAAQKAGIYVGDIITSINNITISSSDQLRETVNSYRYGTTVTVTLMRSSEGEYKEITLDVVLQRSTESSSNEGSNATDDTPTTIPDSENSEDAAPAPNGKDYDNATPEDGIPNQSPEIEIPGFDFDDFPWFDQNGDVEILP